MDLLGMTSVWSTPFQRLNLYLPKCITYKNEEELPLIHHLP